MAWKLKGFSTLEPELINARFVEYFILYKLNLDMNKYQKNNNKNK